PKMTAPSTWSSGNVWEPRGSFPRLGTWCARFALSEGAMATNPDFSDLFSELCAEGAEFLVVGAHAVMFYTVPRCTNDLDSWVRPSLDNAKRVRRALKSFGAPMWNLPVEDLAKRGPLFQIGVEPNRLDVLTSIEGLEFEAAWARRVASPYGSVP